MTTQPLTIEIDATQRVSALWTQPANARACFVLAHGAGAGMAHPFLARVAAGLGERGVATLRYQFPYMERGSKRPDVPQVAHAAVRAAVAHAAKLAPALPLFAGGKSFGARMTSQAQSIEPLAGVRGLALIGFPLHPAGKPGAERAAHLDDVRLPMLLLQGTRDDLAELRLLRPVIDRLGARATLVAFDDADHSFHVPARSGRNDAQVMGELLDALARWIDALLAGSQQRAESAG